MTEDKKNDVILFQNKNIRRVWHEEEWLYSVIDVVAILTDSKDPKDYWYKIKKREEENRVELSTNCRQLKLMAPDGKMRLTDCANTQGMLRIIQSIPSKKAEPFKLWLAQVGKDRIDEIQNPEIAMERMKALYEQKGYPKEWIEKRTRGIAVRQELTDEWKERGAKEGLEYAILTDEINKATFGVKTKEHKEIKDLSPRDNLRDHMVDLELILTMLGEATATEIHKERDSQGFSELATDAKKAGDIAGNARKQIEETTGKPVVSNENYKHLQAKKIKQIKNKKEEE